MRERSVVQIQTSVIEGDFLLDHTAAVFHLSAQLCLVFPQLLLTFLGPESALLGLSLQ